MTGTSGGRNLDPLPMTRSLFQGRARVSLDNHFDAHSVTKSSKVHTRSRKVSQSFRMTLLSTAIAFRRALEACVGAALRMYSMTSPKGGRDKFGAKSGDYRRDFRPGPWAIGNSLATQLRLVMRVHSSSPFKLVDLIESPKGTLMTSKRDSRC